MQASRELPTHVQRGFFVCFIAGLVQLLPAAAVSYGSILISTLAYLSWTGDGDLDFLQGGGRSPDPILGRSAVPREMVLLALLFTVAFVLVDLLCIFSIAIGVKGMGGNGLVVEEQARRISRMAVFCVFAMIPGLGLLGAYAAWAPATIIVVAFAAVLAAVALQAFFLRKIAAYTTELRPRVPGEMKLLACSFMLFAVLLLQLCLTPIIAGNLDSGADWDKYNLGVRILQGVGSALSVISAVISIVCTLGSFLNNSDTFTGARFYKICIGMNLVVLVIGVFITGIINLVMFRRNEQDLGKAKVFWAALEQPLVSLLVLGLVSVLELLASPAVVKPLPSTEEAEQPVSSPK